MSAETVCDCSYRLRSLRQSVLYLYLCVRVVVYMVVPDRRHYARVSARALLVWVYSGDTVIEYMEPYVFLEGFASDERKA